MLSFELTGAVEYTLDLLELCEIEVWRRLSIRSGVIYATYTYIRLTPKYPIG